MKTELYAPVSGRSFDIRESADEVFAAGVAGKGMFIIPDQQQRMILAPCDGKIQYIHDSGHAMMIETGGMVILIHVGIDTVTLKGDCFKPLVAAGDAVRTADPLMQVDFAKIRQKGLACDVMMTVAEPADVTLTYPAGPLAAAGVKMIEVSVKEELD